MCKISGVTAEALSSDKAFPTSGKHDGSSISKTEAKIEEPSLMARYTCASIMMAIFAAWGKYAFVEESEAPGVNKDNIHDYRFPLFATTFYLISLPILSRLTSNLNQNYMKLLLKESMVLYNAGQVVLNGWMVYRYLDAVLFRGHPFIGNIHNVTSGATFGIWIHYCDKYLEFFDTYFMVLRGRMDQVSFLHVYHHFTIAWAWWAALNLFPGGDAYFGALLNSIIHVMMYSYYTLSLLKIPCPWKRYLTMAQLAQFTSVNIYSVMSLKYLHGEADWRQYTGYGIQVFEMTSLFILFFHFYKKSYKSKKVVKEESKKMPSVPSSASVNSDSGSSTSSESSTKSSS